MKNKEILEYFSTEKEAVKYVQLDKHSNRNYIGMYESDVEVEYVLSKLEKRGIKYWTDKIPYGGINDLENTSFCDWLWN